VRVQRRAWIVCLSLALALDSEARELEANRMLPSCPLAALDGDERFDLQRFRGTLLLVDFWASWCTSCPAAFAFLDDLDREFRGRGLRVVGINLDEDRADARRFLAIHPVGFEQASDAGGSCPRLFGVPGMPAAYLIDRGGVIRDEFVGFRAGHADQVRARVEALLAAEAAGEPETRGDTGAR
jgi:thiol-disulfide isomerase/thioredoxin